MHSDCNHITIGGIRYPEKDLVREGSASRSRLERLFAEEYGNNSFQSGVAAFIAEWFSKEPFLTVHTSGSTGKPKEIAAEKQRMISSARLTVDFLGLKEGDTALLCMPVQYIAGKMVIVRAIVAGLDLILVPPCAGPMEHLEKAPVFAAMVPMQVYTSLQSSGTADRLRGVRELIIGGGAIDRKLEEALRFFPHRVWSTYGMTETLSHIALRRLNGKEASEWYSPLEGVKTSLSSDSTLVIHAPAVHAEILETNDIAQMNNRGQFRILGRRDNTVNTGGIKVQIEEVESLLGPLVETDFTVTSVPDDRLGERIVLLVRIDETDVNRQQLIEKIGSTFEKLPHYWRPKEIYPVRELPRTGSGKPDRARARAMARAISLGRE